MLQGFKQRSDIFKRITLLYRGQVGDSKVQAGDQQGRDSAAPEGRSGGREEK